MGKTAKELKAQMENAIANGQHRVNANKNEGYIEKIRPHYVTGWLASLYSGAYNKVRGQLRKDGDATIRREGGHCVMGVYADRVVSLHEEAQWTEDGRFLWGEDWYGSCKPSRTRVNGEAATWAGLDCYVYPWGEWHPTLKSHIVDPHPVSVSNCIQVLNDETDLTLPQLADVLYNVYRYQLDVDLPPRKEIEEMAGRTTPEHDEETSCSGVENRPEAAFALDA